MGYLSNTLHELFWEGIPLMTLLPWLLLATTLTVRGLLMVKRREGWLLDVATIPLWITYYLNNGDWMLIAIPLIFGAMALKALTGAWRRA